MKKITITNLLRSIGEITTILVRGEQIMLTRNGKPFAFITPIAAAKPKTKEKPIIAPKTKSDWPTSYLGKPLSDKKATCPVCYKVVPVEFSNKHFADKHSDI